jgi:hypothetical protein
MQGLSLAAYVFHCSRCETFRDHDHGRILGHFSFCAPHRPFFVDRRGCDYDCDFCCGSGNAHDFCCEHFPDRHLAGIYFGHELPRGQFRFEDLREEDM